MSNVKVSAVKGLMVVGKLLMLLAASPAAADVNNPRFFDYRSGSFGTEILNLTVGWFKTLDADQKSAYGQALTHAIMFAENGQKVEWYRNNASGIVMPAMTWPTGSGYCRRIHIQAVAHNTERTMARSVCFSNASGEWHWVRE